MEAGLAESELHQTGKKLWVSNEYVSEFVYGGIDGAITTFAVVAGAAGANAEIYWVLIFGFANLIADGFSMSVGNFFATRSEREKFEKHQAIEYWEVENIPEKEVEEIREIYAAKGFEGELLEEVVKTITKDKHIWVDTMMKEELEMTKDFRSPFKTASATFLSFIIMGLVPLLSYLGAMVFTISHHNLFLISCVATGIALVFIGYMKAVINQKSLWNGILETLFLGGIAAFLAYFAGVVLASWVL